MHSGLEFELRVHVSHSNSYHKRYAKALDLILTELAATYPSIQFKAQNNWVVLRGDAFIIPAFYWTVGILRAAIHKSCEDHDSWNNIAQLMLQYSTTFLDRWERVLNNKDPEPWKMFVLRYGPQDTYSHDTYVQSYVLSSKDVPEIDFAQLELGLT